DAAHGGEEQHRRAHIGGARGLDQRQPVHRRQHAIDDHDVVFLAGREIEPVAAVVGVVNDMAVLAQALGDVLGGLLVVFDEEDFHFRPFCHPERSEGPFLRRLIPKVPRFARDDSVAVAASAVISGQTQRCPTIQTFNEAAIRSPWAESHISFAKALSRSFFMTKTKTILSALALTTALTAPALIAPLFSAPAAVAAAP